MAMEDGELHTLTAGDAVAVIDPADGCRLMSLAFVSGVDVIGRDEEQPRSSPFHHGCFPMAPFAGRIRHGRFVHDGRTCAVPVNFGDGHAIHGTVYNRAWAPSGTGDAEWTCNLGDRWPFPGHAVQRASLTPSSLRLELEVHAAEGGPSMPATLGWHPWFPRTIGGRAAELQFGAGRQYRKDDEGIPDGRTAPPWGDDPLDDCFTDIAWARPPMVTWPGVGSVEVVSDASHLVVYTAPATALCVEPQTGPPDAPNLGAAAVVSPGRPLRAWMELRWRAAPSGSAGSGRGGARSRTG
jgi:aldose 1-epimerase